MALPAPRTGRLNGPMSTTVTVSTVAIAAADTTFAEIFMVASLQNVPGCGNRRAEGSRLAWDAQYETNGGRLTLPDSAAQGRNALYCGSVWSLQWLLIKSVRSAAR